MDTNHIRKWRYLILISFLLFNLVLVNASSFSFNKIPTSVNINNQNVTNIYQNVSGDGNSSWNESRANLLYANIIWGYNQTAAGSLFDYNQSAIVFTQISNQNASWISTYNATYALFAYNQTAAGNLYNYNETLVILTTNLTGVNSITGSRWNYSTKDSILSFNGFNDVLASSTAPSGGIRFDQLRPEAKAGIWWNAFDPISNQNQEVAWLMAHYNSTNGNTHQHFSIETLDNSSGTPSVNSKLEIDYGSNIIIPSVRVSGSNFVVTNIANFSKNGLSKITPNGTLDIYPNTQSTFALRISNDTFGITLSTLGSTYVTYADNLNVSAGLDICITGGNCLSTAGGDNSTWNEVYANQLYISDGNLSELFSTYNLTYAPWSYNQTTISKAYTDAMILANSSLFGSNVSIYNQSYAIFAYNQSTFPLLQISNQNASWISTFNATYAPFAYNETLASGWVSNTTVTRLTTLTNFVGIGTANPQFNLHINSSGASTNVSIQSSGTDSEAGIRFRNDAQFVDMYIEGVNDDFILSIGGARGIIIDETSLEANFTKDVSVSGGNLKIAGGEIIWNGTCLNTLIGSTVVMSVGCV